YRNYYNAALAAAPKKVFLPCVSLPRANFYENIFYNAFALTPISFILLQPHFFDKINHPKFVQTKIRV
ncbi:MAG: hypothetical protein PUJ82_09920, partial [Spirochaetales bacterium]|nr:hypothetical protein [Spirochaetales bacterium]MDY5916091.1 hypothetical protein [Treponema sp.]